MQGSGLPCVSVLCQEAWPLGLPLKSSYYRVGEMYRRTKLARWLRAQAFFRGPRFTSQVTLPVTPASGDPGCSSDLRSHLHQCAHNRAGETLGKSFRTKQKEHRRRRQRLPVTAEVLSELENLSPVWTDSPHQNIFYISHLSLPQGVAHPT